ncbi:hypothetical protein EZV62_011138 [Acer yangbiense]|uniref:Uncharacterized protein n=1 Tax=Acer yangbiense TaxID=1000413 RepID=A0A5C7I4X6_9ROSI|nr:hypothetical protein EZV62_011138 [Acer yangbiense]
MVAAIPQAASTAKTSSRQQDVNPTTSSRPPLLPSEKDNGHRNGVNNSSRKPRGRQVSSRYMSPSPSSSSSSSSTTTTTTTTTTPKTHQRFSSPLLSRSTNSSSTQQATTFQSLGPKRSQSVDRRRPTSATTPRPTTPLPNSKQSNANQELSTATKMLITSTRSLSVSFQGETFSLPISKTKAKATPERRRATPVRDQPWPSRTRQGNPGSNPLTRSLDCSGVAESKKFVGIGSGVVAKSFQRQSLIENESRLSLDLSNARQNPDGNLLVNEPCCVSSDLVSSDDTDSVSSGSTNTSGVPESGGTLSRMNNGARGIVVSARFWQETNSRLRRLQDPGSPLSTSPGSRMSNSSKYLQSKRFSTDGAAVSMSPRGMSSPIRGATRPASPSKVWNGHGMSPSRGIASPSRVRNSLGGVLSGNSNNTPSILSFSVDMRRGKVGEDRIVDAHMLRLLYNRYLQWRFVNARADATFMVQKLNAEHQWPVNQKLFTFDVMYLHDKPGPDNCPQAAYDALVDALELVTVYEGYILESGQGSARVLFRQMFNFLEEIIRYFGYATGVMLMVRNLFLLPVKKLYLIAYLSQFSWMKNLWNAWVTISELRHSVTLKRVKLLLLRQKLKLTSILKGQMPYLEDWALLDRDHCNSLLGATEALKASTLRLPVVGKAIADIQNLKDAISSAVDVMQAMASSICLLSSKVESINSLVAEMVNVTAKERFLLEQCKDFSSALAAMQTLQSPTLSHSVSIYRFCISHFPAPLHFPNSVTQQYLEESHQISIDHFGAILDLHM